MNKTVFIEGMKCQGCVDSIKERFEAIAGVDAAEVDLANKKATITGSKDVSLDELRKSLEGTKFTISE
ncbi:heavy-metal-associated domain-containing protein [Clostridium sp. Marseille-P299]|uniref:heavy-metal-associated domain-containing protein n=1 Tax=Clostridium sp. Marseille-P299 TaxID=1805477 RepID=UPI00082C2767|nr:heavy metal-associated domain-containing protein [Clostridium sp. Marseille-P299]